MRKKYDIIAMGEKELEKALKDMDKAIMVVMPVVASCYSPAGVIEWLEEHKATDETHSIEIYTVDDDFEFVDGCDYDTPSNFIRCHKRALEQMPFDHAFIVDGNEELCHGTGYEVLGADGIWWNQYEDRNGEYHYGN